MVFVILHEHKLNIHKHVFCNSYSLPKSKPFLSYLLIKGTQKTEKVPSLLCRLSIALCASHHVSFKMVAQKHA